MSNNIKKISGHFTGERALFQEHDIEISDSSFADGESPLKECHNVWVNDSLFRWRYPVWYSNNIHLKGCTMFIDARAPLWYINDSTITDCVIYAPKSVRRCERMVMEHVNFPNAVETLWHCKDVTLKDVSATGDYFAMNSENLKLDHFTLIGKYSFDGVKNVEITNSTLVTKDAFWNSENVTVKNSKIYSEYLGWNAKNLTLIDCTIESLQGLCYVDNLTIENCKFIDTTLAFEYSSVNATIVGKIDSILNPSSGKIVADGIGTLIMEPDKVDITKTEIVCDKIEATADKAEY